MTSPKVKPVSIHGNRLGLAPGYIVVDGAQAGPPINVSATVASNTATVTEETLKTYSLPGRTLDASNQGIYVRAFGRTGSGTTRFKRATLVIGGVSMTTASISDSGGTWVLEGRYFKTGSSTQRALTGGQVASTMLALTSTTDTATDTSDITISLKSTSGSGTTSDIFCDALEVGFV